MSHKDMIFVHCLATPLSWGKDKSATEMVEEVRQWHKAKGWRDIGYAEIIDYEGRRAKGRDLDSDGDVWEETAAAAKGYNRRGVHVALAGGHGSTANDAPEEHYTPEQLAALREVIEEIQEHFGKPMWVRGHNEVAAKACPGFNVKEWWEGRPPRKKSESTTLRADVAAAIGGVGTAVTAVASLDGTAQIVAIVCATVVLLGTAVVFRERIRGWNRGWR